MGDAGWRRRRPRRPRYLGHLRPQVDLLQVDGVRPEVVEQLAEQDSIAEGLGQVEHLRRVPGHPVVGGQHLAVDEPLRALLPRLHARRRLDAARPGQAAEMRRRLCRRRSSAPPTPAAAGPLPARVRRSKRRGGRIPGPAPGSAPIPARVRRLLAAAAASPARSSCAPAGSAAAVAHRLPTCEPGAGRLSMPSARAGLAAVCESPEARVGERAPPWPRVDGPGGEEKGGEWGCEGDPSRRPRPPRALRSAELAQPQASGDLPLGESVSKQCNSVGTSMRTSKTQFLKGPRGAKG